MEITTESAVTPRATPVIAIPVMAEIDRFFLERI